MNTLDTLNHKKYGLEKQPIPAGSAHWPGVYSIKAKSLRKALNLFTDALSEVNIKPDQVMDGATSVQLIFVKLPSGEMFQLGRPWNTTGYEIIPIFQAHFDYGAKAIKEAEAQISLKARAKATLASNGFSPEDIKNIFL